jgi:hypothetical protein
MAQIPVEKKSSSAWWVWLIGLLVLLVVGWFVWQNFNQDNDRLNMTSPAPVTGTPDNAPATTTGTPLPADNMGSGNRPTGTGAGDLVTDADTYGSSSDRLALVGREVALDSARVARVVGPKSFTLASGSEELLVLIDQDLSRGVSTQGQIDQGNTINLKGNFQRIEPAEIDNIASNRFRDLTEPEREWLRKTEVYLHATEFSKVN